MLSLLHSSVFVRGLLLLLLLAWLAGSIAMMVSDAHDARRRQSSQTEHDSAPPILSPAEAISSDHSPVR